MKFDLVIFDLGGVLIDVNFDHLIHAFAKRFHISDDEVRAIWRAKKDLLESFDRGLIAPLEFYNQLLPDSSNLLFDEFCHLYTDIFSVNSESLAIATDLQPTITILSNTDELHFGALQKFDIFYHFSNITTSFETHLLKPEEAIYQHVLEKFKVRPDRCIFIDDRIENIVAAKSIGIYAIHFQNAAALRKELMQLDIMNTDSKRRVHYAEIGN